MLDQLQHTCINLQDASSSKMAESVRLLSYSSEQGNGRDMGHVLVLFRSCITVEYLSLW